MLFYSKPKIQCVALRPSVPWKLRKSCFIFIHSEYSVLLRSELHMIYLSTAIGLTPGGGGAVHIYTQTIHRTIHITTEQHK